MIASIGHNGRERISSLACLASQHGANQDQEVSCFTFDGVHNPANHDALTVDESLEGS